MAKRRRNFTNKITNRGSISPTPLWVFTSRSAEDRGHDPARRDVAADSTDEETTPTGPRTRNVPAATRGEAAGTPKGHDPTPDPVPLGAKSTDQQRRTRRRPAPCHLPSIEHASRTSSVKAAVRTALGARTVRDGAPELSESLADGSLTVARMLVSSATRDEFTGCGRRGSSVEGRW